MQLPTIASIESNVHLTVSIVLHASLFMLCTQPIIKFCNYHWSYPHNEQTTPLTCQIQTINHFI